MKSLKVLVPVGILLLSWQMTAFAHEGPDSITEALRTKVIRLIDQPDLSDLNGNTFKAEVEFMLTRHKEIIVLAVHTDNAYLDTYIKNKLNYNKINLRGIPTMKSFTLDVTFNKAFSDYARS